MPPSSKHPSPKVSRRWAFMVIVTGYLVYFIVDGVNYADGLFLNIFREEFKISPYTASLYSSIARGFSYVVAIFVGPLTRRFSCSVVAMGGCIIGTIFLFISSFATNIVYLCFSYGLGMGMAISGTVFPCMICATLYFRKHRGLAVGLISSGSGVGAFAFAPISAHLISSMGWRSVYKVYAAMFFLATFPAAFLRPQSPSKTCQQLCLGTMELWYKTWAEATHCCRDVHEVPLSLESKDTFDGEEEENDMVVHPVSAPPPRRIKLPHAASRELKKLRSLYQDHCVVLCCLAGFVSTSALYVPPVYLVSYAIHNGVEEENAALLLSCMGLANMTSRILLGWFVDLKIINAVVVYCIGTFVGGAATVLIWKYHSFTALIIYAVVYGLSMGCNISLISVVLVQLVGLASYQDIYSIVNFWCGVGALFGPPSLGYMYDVTEQYHTVFVISGLVLAIGAFIWFVTPFLMTKDVTGPIKVHISMSPLDTTAVTQAFVHAQPSDKTSTSAKTPATATATATQ